MRHSPLVGVTSNPAHIEEFITHCKNLMTEVGEGHPPVAQHRMRVLIYPRAVYDKYNSRVAHLLRLHAVGRVVCIPLIAEELEKALSLNERGLIRNLAVNQLGQSLRDKMPPQPITRRGALRSLAQVSSDVIFPDLLLIDPTREARQLWWYNENVIQHLDGSERTVIDNAYQVFRTVCAKGRNAIWTNFSATQIGKLPIVADLTSTSAELFFALDYYQRWLTWIHKNAASDPAAGALNRWQDSERNNLRRFIDAEVERIAGEDPSRQLHVIDVGCGFGRHLLDLASESPRLIALGIDVIPSMVAHASHDARVQHLDDRLYFCQDDAAVLSSARDGEFEIAICMTNTLGNLESPKVSQALEQIRRVLKPGGKLVLSIYSPNSVDSRFRTYENVGLHVERRNGKILASEGLESAHFTSESIRGILAPAGFSIRETSDLEGIGWFVIAQRT